MVASSLGTTDGFTTALTTTTTTHGMMALGTIPAASTMVGPVVSGPGRPVCLSLAVRDIVAEIVVPAPR
jgi:hypothetical protein